MIKSRAKAAVKAMAHQAASLAHDATHPEVLDFSDPGTGKTFVRIMAFAARRAKRGGCALVLAPRSLLRATWQADLAKFAPHLKVSVAVAANREKAFAADADIYITNHDAVNWLVKQKAPFFKKFDELIIDESPAYKHHTSLRSRSALKLSQNFTQRKLMTATPTSNGICDIWHQVLICDGGKRLGNSFYGFRNSVCTPKQVGRDPNAIKWTDKDGAEEAVFGLLSDIVVRHKFEDCVDIPATHTHTIEYHMTPKQQRMYDDMEQNQLLPLLTSTNTINAVHAASVATKLMQITSGAVYDAAGNYAVLDETRYEMLIDLAQERKHPFMLFFWRHQRDLLLQHAKSRKMRVAYIDGSVDDDERYAINLKYQRGEYDLLLGHPQSVAHGFTFTKGTSTIWAGPTHNLEWFKQGSRRQARIGQTERTEVLTVIAKGTREEEVYDLSLMPKNRRMSRLLSLFELATEETMA